MYGYQNVAFEVSFCGLGLQLISAHPWASYVWLWLCGAGYEEWLYCHGDSVSVLINVWLRSITRYISQCPSALFYLASPIHELLFLLPSAYCLLAFVDILLVSYLCLHSLTVLMLLCRIGEWSDWWCDTSVAKMCMVHWFQLFFWGVISILLEPTLTVHFPVSWVTLWSYLKLSTCSLRTLNIFG